MKATFWSAMLYEVAVVLRTVRDQTLRDLLATIYLLDILRRRVCYDGLIEFQEGIWRLGVRDEGRKQ